MKVKLLDEKCEPFKKYDTDAGWDLICAESVILPPGKNAKIPAGIAVEIPAGYVGDISPRSSASAKDLLIQGKVDPGYTGPVKIIVTNCGNNAFKINAGDRIAQLVVIKILQEDLEFVDKLPESERGSRGFGSSGK